MGGNKMRNKGITMISLVITIAVISIIAGTVIYGSVQNIQERDLDLFYSDLQTLEDRVNQYEIHYGKLPTKGIFSGSTAFQSVKNPNDNDIYYNLDLNALDNLSLSRTISMQGDDVYIVNDASHTIYYPQGLTIKGEVYYRYPHEYSKIEDNIYADLIIQVCPAEHMYDGTYLYNTSLAIGGCGLKEGDSIKSIKWMNMATNTEISDITHAFCDPGTYEVGGYATTASGITVKMVPNTWIIDAPVVPPAQPSIPTP